MCTVFALRNLLDELPVSAVGRDNRVATRKRFVLQRRQGRF
jgi:hypothetical protein